MSVVDACRWCGQAFSHPHKQKLLSSSFRHTDFSVCCLYWVPNANQYTAPGCPNKGASFIIKLVFRPNLAKNNQIPTPRLFLLSLEAKR